MRKSQAALEFLTTYAWAIISILIVLGALYYFWGNGLAGKQPHVCEMGEQLECLDAMVTYRHFGKMMVRNNFADTIILTEWGCKERDSADWMAGFYGVWSNLSDYPNGYAIAPAEIDNVYFWTGCAPFAREGDRIHLRVGFKYFFNSSPNKTPHWVWGQVSANGVPGPLDETSNWLFGDNDSSGGGNFGGGSGGDGG